MYGNLCMYEYVVENETCPVYHAHKVKEDTYYDWWDSEIKLKWIKKLIKTEFQLNLNKKR